MANDERICPQCNEGRTRTGFRDGVCKGCWKENNGQVPPAQLLEAVHTLLGTTYTRERSQRVREILKTR